MVFDLTPKMDSIFKLNKLFSNIGKVASKLYRLGRNDNDLITSSAVHHISNLHFDDRALYSFIVTGGEKTTFQYLW